MDKKVKRNIAQDLSANLWKMADDLRGTMEAYEFKNYILGVIFYKFLSDKTEKHMNEALELDNLTYQEAWELEDYREDLIKEELEILGYVIEPKYLFSNVIKMIEKDEFSIDYLEEIINSIVESTQGQDSQDDFEGLFEDMDLKSSKLGKAVKERSKAIAKMIQTLDTIEMDIDSVDEDILGAAYIELISKFASTAGKKAGEFFTMSTPATLVARLATLGLKECLNAFDPACGSGSLLLKVGDYTKVTRYYGQELTSSTYNLARMNMMLHGIPFKRFEIINCNTITDDEALGNVKFNVQVANPPYSVKWDPDPKLLEDDRFSGAGVLAPKGYEDLMFVEHMIYHMADGDSRIAVLLPHGVLFRGGAEEKIRKYMIETQNVLDAVIGLPAKLFVSTGIPVTCLVFKKERNGNSNNICFIDASKEFGTEGKMNYLTDENIDKIVNAYAERKDIDKYCHIATMDEIRENGYNLNIPRYVDTFEEEEEIDMGAVINEINNIDAQIKETSAELKKYFDELGIPFPNL